MGYNNIYKFAIFCILGVLMSACASQEKSDFSQREEAPQSQKIILALGDSLTAGYGLSEDESYPSQLEKLLSENGYNYEIINGGVSGNTSDDLLSRISLYKEIHPEIVILVIGANDAFRGLSLESLEKNIEEIIDFFPNSQIVLGGMDIPQNLGREYRNDFKKLYENIAKNNKDIFFFPYFLEGVGGVASLNQADMIHPTTKGYEVIVKNLFHFLLQKNILEK